MKTNMMIHKIKNKTNNKKMKKMTNKFNIQKKR